MGYWKRLLSSLEDTFDLGFYLPDLDDFFLTVNRVFFPNFCLQGTWFLGFNKPCPLRLIGKLTILEKHVPIKFWCKTLSIGDFDTEYPSEIIVSKDRYYILAYADEHDGTVNIKTVEAVDAKTAIDLLGYSSEMNGLLNPESNVDPTDWENEYGDKNNYFISGDSRVLIECQTKARILTPTCVIHL